ncbi:MAG TPA: hypothetical protein PL033_03000 [Candidatus Brocadiia bacterium]|nr:hypothetical protein [Candidatus Brocadiia bacterium]
MLKCGRCPRFSVYIWKDEKHAKIALAAPGGYVAFAGHSNFGVGPWFGSGSATCLEDFMNTAHELQEVGWDYLRHHQGHTAFRTMPTYGDDSTTTTTFDPCKDVVELDGYRFPRYTPSVGFHLTFVPGPDKDKFKDHHKTWKVGPVSTGRNGLVCCCGAADMPVQRYRKIYLQCCYSGEYFHGVFNHGTLFYALGMPGDDATDLPPYTSVGDRRPRSEKPIPAFIMGIIQGEDNDSILNRINQPWAGVWATGDGGTTETDDDVQYPRFPMHDYREFTAPPP